MPVPAGANSTTVNLAFVDLPDAKVPLSKTNNIKHIEAAKVYQTWVVLIRPDSSHVMVDNVIWVIEWNVEAMRKDKDKAKDKDKEKEKDKDKVKDKEKEKDKDKDKEKDRDDDVTYGVEGELMVIGNNDKRAMVTSGTLANDAAYVWE